MASRKDLLAKIEKRCINCLDCELGKSRNKIVFSDGDAESAKYVLVGEAPGANEDMSGVPFVGRAGKLLNEYLQKSGISREKDLYIINTVKCRPPENRVPTKQEKEFCRKYLVEQIKIINPKVLILCGTTAFQSFVNEKIPISKIRGKWLEVELENVKYKAMAVFHPSYLLRNYSEEDTSPRGLFLSDLKLIKSV